MLDFHLKNNFCHSSSTVHACTSRDLNKASLKFFKILIFEVVVHIKPTGHLQILEAVGGAVYWWR